MHPFAPPPTAPSHAAEPAPAGAAPAAGADRPGTALGRAAAVLSLGAGLTAVLMAGLGTVVALATLPAVVSLLLGAAGLVAGVVALVSSRARSLEVTLLSAAGGVSAVVAAVVTALTLLFPFGLPPLDGPATTPEDAAGPSSRLPEDVLADLHARALPLGESAALEQQDVAVVAVRSDPADVAARLAELEWLAQDVGTVRDVVLVELDAPVDGGDWVPVVEHGDVSVVTPRGVPHGALLAHGSRAYDVDGLVEPAADGRPRGRVVVAVAVPPDEAPGGMVVVTSPSWTDVGTWSVPSW